MLRALLLLTFVALPLPAAAQVAPAPPEAAPTPLVVGVVDSPPFAVQTAEGVWTGLTVALWTDIASALQLRYEFRPLLLGDVDAALAERRVDVALGAIAVTPEGAAAHDFTQPYLATGLGFAQRDQDVLSWGAFAGTVFGPHILKSIAAMFVATFIVGTLIAIVERRAHTGDFGGSIPRSVSTGVWWAAVTMTTVGYGDATPKTAAGRALALVWMFVGVVAVAILTAAVTSKLTVSHLRGAVNSPADLFHLRLGVVAGGAGADYVDHHHVYATPYPTYEAALQALDDGSVDAVVGNIPALRTEVAQAWTGRLRISPITLEPVTYAIALPPGSPLTAPVNRTLLAITHDERWQSTEEAFLGHH